MRLLHNCRVKRYPDGSADIVAASAPFGGGDLHREPSRMDDASDPWANVQDPEHSYAALERAAIEDDGVDDLAQAKRREASLERAKRRARVAVRDLGLCNDFRFFVTLTLDQERIDRYDAREVIRHLNHWLDNNVRRKGLKYVLVPEHHKDGAIHFHGFFNDALEAVDSGHKDKQGHTVYNLPGWGWGFSTAIQLYGERAAAVNYACKYISKAQEKIGGRWYYSGGDLKRPDVEWLDVDYHKMLELEDASPFQVPGLSGVQFLHLRADRTDVSDASEEMPELAAGMENRIPRPAPASAPASHPGSVRCQAPEENGSRFRLPTPDAMPTNLQDSCRSLQFLDCPPAPRPPAPQAPESRGDPKMTTKK